MDTVKPRYFDLKVKYVCKYLLCLQKNIHIMG